MYKETTITNEDNRVLTRGEKLVGIGFNPSGDPEVWQTKSVMAEVINFIDHAHNKATQNGAASSTWERNMLHIEAINALVTAQMAAVKYLTWED